MMVNGYSLCKKSEEFTDFDPLCKDKVVMDVSFNNFWSKMGVFNYSEDSTPRVEV